MIPVYTSARRAEILRGNPGVRSEIAAVSTYFHFSGRHGIIQEIMENYGIPRNTFMRKVDWVLESVGENRRAIKQEVKRLKEEKKALQKQLRKHQQNSESLRKELDEIKDGIGVRKTKLILLSAVLKNSLRDVAALVECAFGKSISHTQVARVLAHFEEDAIEIMGKHFAVGIETGCPDEIFFHRDPILVIVEALSHCIVAIEKRTSRTTEDWKQVLARIPFMRNAVNDKGSGIVGALTNEGIPWQLDVYHIMQELKRAFRILERKTYALITNEEALKKKLGKLVGRTQNKGKTIWVSRDLKQVQRDFETAAEVHELTEWIMDEIGLSLGWFTPRGKLNTAEELRENLGILCEWLKELSPLIFKKFVTYVDETQVGTFLEILHEKLSGIDTTNPWNISHEMIVEHIGREWIRSRQKGGALFPSHIELRRVMTDMLLSQWDGYAEIKERVTDAFETTHRCSSSVENVNGRLRLYEHAKKHLDQMFLSLAALYHNMTPFKDGAKRQGKSPAELLKLSLPTPNFFEMLGLQAN